MSGTYNRNGGQLTHRRPGAPFIFHREGSYNVSFNGKVYTYDDWIKMERKSRDSTDT